MSMKMTIGRHGAPRNPSARALEANNSRDLWKGGGIDELSVGIGIHAFVEALGTAGTSWPAAMRSAARSMVFCVAISGCGDSSTAPVAGVASGGEGPVASAGAGGRIDSTGSGGTGSGGAASDVVSTGGAATDAASTGGAAPGGSSPAVRLTLSTEGIASATGRAVPDPIGTSCGPGCFTYGEGQTVEIAAAGDQSALFAAWSGDCVGHGQTCTLIMSADKSAHAHFRPNMNIMFVTESTLVPATIGSDLARADSLCAESAAAAWLGGSTWKAWMATSRATTNINAATHVGRSTTGWIRTDGRPFATSMANLLAGKIYYPPRLTERNAIRSDEYAVVTGADTNGDAIENGTCGDWTSSGSAYNGDVTTTTSSWTFQFLTAGDSCRTTNYPIYCFENDNDMIAVPAPVAPGNVRRAFLSESLWVPGGGVAAADAVCQTDAMTAGLPNAADYRALLTTSVAATDPSRINLAGQPWARLDDAQLVATATDLAAPTADKLLTSLNVGPSGGYIANFAAWTGTAATPSINNPGLNCNNWTSGSPSVSSGWGLANGSSPAWWAGNMQACNTPSALYCFER